MDEEGHDRPFNGPREAPAVMAGPGSGDRAEQFGQGVAMGTGVQYDIGKSIDPSGSAKNPRLLMIPGRFIHDGERETYLR
jgi:hypothetical protein